MSNDPQHVTPFEFKYDQLSPSSLGDPGSADALSDYERGKGVASTSRTLSPPATSAGSFSTSNLVASSASSSALPPPPTVQHQDSGIRGLILPETVEEVPPLYSED
jgi:hypothetical protein